MRREARRARRPQRWRWREQRTRNPPEPVLIRRFAARNQAVDDHEPDADADRGVRDVERRPVPSADMKVEKINEGAEPQTGTPAADRHSQTRRAATITAASNEKNTPLSAASALNEKNTPLSAASA